MSKLDAKTIMRSATHSEIMKYRSIKPLIVEAVQVSGPAVVRRPDSLLQARAGDWLVVDPHGNIRLCSDAYFRGHYARLLSSKRLEEFREQNPGSGC